MTEEYGIFWGDGLYNVKRDEHPIIESFLYQQDMMLIHAEEGIGKSVLVQQLMFDLTSGSPFLGSFTTGKKHKVLWAQSEGSRGKHIERIENMKKSLKIDDSMWVHSNTCDVCFDSKEETDRFIEMIHVPKINYDVIIFDSLYGFVDGDLNSNKVAKDVTRNLRRIAGEFQAAMIVISHVGKEQYAQLDGHKIEKSKKNVYGARHWAAFFTQIYHFSIKKGVHTLSLGKDRDGNCVQEVQLRMIVPQTDPDERLMFEAINEEDSAPHIVAQLEGYIEKKQKCKQSELRRIFTGSEAYFYRLLRKLEEVGKIKREMIGGIKWIIAQQTLSIL